MKKYSHFLLAILVLGLSILACSSSLQVVGTPSSAPQQSNTPIVVPAVLLPHALYYSGADNDGLTQIFRL